MWTDESTGSRLYDHHEHVTDDARAEIENRCRRGRLISEHAMSALVVSGGKFDENILDEFLGLGGSIDLHPRKVHCMSFVGLVDALEHCWQSTLVLG